MAAKQRKRTKSTGKSRRKGNRRNGKRGGIGRFLRRVTLLAVSVFLIAGGLWTAWLDHLVTDKFEGQRWALPARVYARPLELYQGLHLTADAFARELRAAGYQAAGRADAPGRYQRNGGRFVVHRRSFRFWDGSQPAVRLALRFRDGRLASLTRAGSGERVELTRLDPARIGSVYPGNHEDRILVQLDDVPRSLVAALLAVEDRRFADHFGVSPMGILRAAIANLRAGHIVQGGSTLTQQLVKNFYLNDERTLWRKANEAIMAVLLEWHYGKREILEAYLNEVYLGQDGERAIHGFGLASQFYFGRPLQQLSLAQQALLVGMVKGPSYYHPRRHPERARQRRDLVLKLMAEEGFAPEDAVARAKKERLSVLGRAPESDTTYPAFMDLVRRHLTRDYREADLRSEGLRIFTTLAPSVQRAVESAVTERTATWSDATEAAAVVVGVDTGEVEALVGGRDPRYAGFNRALDARRPIGSLVKPAVYLTALARPERYGLGSVLSDEPVTVQAADGRSWTPRNYDRERHGDVALWEALAHSYNVPTVRLGLSVGLRAVADTLERLGADVPRPVYPSLLLGSVEQSPLEVARLYETLATGGYRTPLRAVRAVMTGDGEVLSRYSLRVEHAFDRESVYLLRTALEQVVAQGTGRGLQRYLGAHPGVAGKTGTTDDLRDSWFAGYAANRLGVVWVGRDDNGRTGLTGATGAMTIWGELFAALPYRPLSGEPPAGVEAVWIDSATGRRASAQCRGAVELPYVRGEAPSERAECARERNVVERAGDWLRGLVN
ncbi:penicillin-binding protein 1B [Arhodomonas sp. AD133]|uniref:penicillin-binding protein 1B n=1 Tax=Arhodomonas sp. AD133 TaxID=3415009 RepID=UPI003EBA30DD